MADLDIELSSAR